MSDYDCEKTLDKKELAKLRKWLHGEGFPMSKNQCFQVLANPTRHKMVILLMKQGGLSVCDIATILCVSPSAISQHLKSMSEMKLVESKRDGQTIYYSLSKSELVDIIKKCE